MLICFVFLIYIIFFSYSFFSSVIKTTTTTTKLQNRPNIVYIHKNSTNCFSSGWMAQTTQNITAANNYYQHWINTQKKNCHKKYNRFRVFVCVFARLFNFADARLWRKPKSKAACLAARLQSYRVTPICRAHRTKCSGSAVNLQLLP